MNGMYMMDRVESPIFVIAAIEEGSPIEWLSINPWACRFLGVKKEAFLANAAANMPVLAAWEAGEKTLLEIEGNELFCAPPLECGAYPDTFEGQPCWVLMGEFQVPFEGEKREVGHTLMEEAIRHSISDAVIITDTELRVKSWNQAACQLYGWNGKEVEGKRIGEVIPTTYVKEKRPRVLRQFAESGSWEGEVLQVGKGGKQVYVHSAVNTVRDAAGNALGVIAVNRDITNRKAIENALQESETRLKLAGQVAYDLIYEWDPHTGGLIWFGDIDSMLGFPKGTISHDISAWLERIHPEDRKKMEAAVVYHTTHDDPIDDVYRIMHADGHYLHWKDDALAVVEEGKIVKFVGVCRDITEKTLSESQLRERERLLTTISENFPRAYLSVIYPDLTVGYTNGQEFKLAGIDPEQFVGLHVRDVFGLYGEEVVEKVQAAYQKTFEGHPQVFEIQLGEEYQQFNTVPIEGEDGQVDRMLAVVRNVTDAKVREIKLQESEEKFSKAFREHPVPMEIFDVHNGQRVEVNESFIRLLGYSREQIQQSGMDGLDLWIDTDRRTIALEALKTYGKVQDFPLDMKTQKGNIRHLLVSAAMLDTGSGNMAIVSLVDITLRKMAEESLRTSEAHLQTLLDTIPDMVFLKDPEGRFIWCNQRFATLLNARIEEIIGKTDYDFASEPLADAYRREDILATEAPGPRKMEETVRVLTTGEEIKVETIKTAMYDEQEELIGVLGIARDITERIRQMSMLEQQNEALKNISWMQSHEVRAPLANIMGLIGLLENNMAPTDEERTFIYQEIINAAHILDGIIHQIVEKTQEYLWKAQPNKADQPLEERM